MEPIGLLLTGRIGNGKSSTGNSTLNNKRFPVSNSGTSKMIEPMKGTTTINGRIVNIVDGIDVGDNDDVESLRKTAKKTFKVLTAGFTAILVVLKFGVRFTKQEQDAVRLIRSVFGPDIFRNRVVIVVSYGDNFDLDMESAGSSSHIRCFKDWCDEQRGAVRDLFEECGSRIVLFNNKAKHGSKEMENQVNQLMSEVSKIELDSPYTMDDLPAPSSNSWKWLLPVGFILSSIGVVVYSSDITAVVCRLVDDRILPWCVPYSRNHTKAKIE